MLESLPHGQWDHRRAAHLLRRISIGVRPEEIAVLASMPFDDAIDHILKPLPIDFDGYRHLTHDDVVSGVSPIDAPEWHAYFREKNLRYGDVRRWWIRTMLSEGTSIQERMVLFWHMLFTTSMNGAHYAEHVLDQNLFMRDNCLGDLRAMVDGITHGTAMQIYLDGIRNEWHDWFDGVNENHARELFELQTLGIPSDISPAYTQGDVAEAARAFSGWRLDEYWKDNGNGVRTLYRKRNTVWRKDHWDYRHKAVFGRTGPWNGHDVVSMLFTERPTHVARHICRRILAEFLTASPDERLVDALAQHLIDSGWSIGSTMRTLFRSGEFYAPGYRMGLVRSPIHLLVGTLRTIRTTYITDLDDADGRSENDLLDRLSSMGHLMYDPPNVSGWAGGMAWLSAASVPTRIDLCRRIALGEVEFKDYAGGRYVYTYDAYALASSLADPSDLEALVRATASFFLDTVDPHVYDALRFAFLQGASSPEWYAAQDDPTTDRRLRLGFATALGSPRYQLH